MSEPDYPAEPQQVPEMEQHLNRYEELHNCIGIVHERLGRLRDRLMGSKIANIDAREEKTVAPGYVEQFNRINSDVNLELDRINEILSDLERNL